MALMKRRSAIWFRHSDRGSPCASIAFGQRCEAAGVRSSIGAVGYCCDNVPAGGFFATPECEFIERNRFRTPAEARLAVYSVIVRYSGLRYISPPDYDTESLEASRLYNFQTVREISIG